MPRGRTPSSVREACTRKGQRSRRDEERLDRRVLAIRSSPVAERRHRHPPAFDTPRAARADESDGGDGTYRVLIVADEGCTSPALAEELTERALGRRVEALVVAPALGSWLARWTDDDRRQADAQTHLATTMETLATAGISARGETGSDDPIQAADDGLRRFGQMRSCSSRAAARRRTGSSETSSNRLGSATTSALPTPSSTPATRSARPTHFILLA